MPGFGQPTSNFEWCSPSHSLTLEDSEVHVWRAYLQREPSCIHRLKTTLAPDELARAEQFYFERDRDRFRIARGVLRLILASYLNVEPQRLQFCYSPYGKPAILGESSSRGIRFNISHSYELALYAITRGREIGIDVEHIRPELANEGIAERFFSPREVAALRALPTNTQQKAFFACWTRKEAYIKARGEGLTLPLDEFDVSLAPGEPAALLYTNGDPQEASRWSLQELTPGAAYIAAVAVEGHAWQLKCWQWPEQWDEAKRCAPRG